MASGNSPKTSWWGRFLARPNDDPVKTVFITLAVAIVGSVLVAGTAVYLKPLQIVAKEKERRSHIEAIIRLLPGAADLYRVEAHVVDLKSGKYVPSVNPGQFDQRRATRDPGQRTDVPAKLDIAGLKMRSRFAVVYLVKRDELTKLVILPVRGRGYGAMIYGYLGLAGDLNTVVGLTFYEHGETPGLGALIDSPDWKAKWRGKKVGDGAVVMLGVGPGRVKPNSREARYRVDAITGATWTGQGVNNLLHYWLGEHGFRPFLRRLRTQGG